MSTHTLTNHQCGFLASLVQCAIPGTASAALKLSIVGYLNSLQFEVVHPSCSRSSL